MMNRIKPDVIIHAAAFTAVDAAERECELAYAINAYGTRNLALAAQQHRAKLLYVSTDYVFDGKKGSYVETDDPVPLNVYGRSKLLGEKFAATLCEKHYILRTSWLYGAGGNNFVKKIYAASCRQSKLSASTENFGSPTYAHDLAHFIRLLIKTDKYGIYHAAGRGGCSRYEFAEAILKTACVDHVHITPVTADAFQLSARRPCDTSLDDLAIRRNQLPRFRHWRLALEEYIKVDPYFKEGMRPL